MKKIVCLICIVVVMLTAIVPVSASISCEQVHYPMYFNGTLVPEGDKPILSLNWNTYVPLRKVCEGTGLEVVWNNEKQEIYVENTSALAAQDYAALSEIYSNTYVNGLYEIIIFNAFYDAFDYLEAGEYTLYQTCLEVMETYLKSIDLNIESSKILIESLNGYYDGQTVSKTTYDNVANCLLEDMVLSLSCDDLRVSLTSYANGSKTYKGLLEDLDLFYDNIEYAKGLVIIPSVTSSSITSSVGKHSVFSFYSEFQSKKADILN